MESRTKVAAVPDNAKKRTALYSRSTSAKRKEEEVVGEAVESQTERTRRSPKTKHASKRQSDAGRTRSTIDNSSTRK